MVETTTPSVDTSRELPPLDSRSLPHKGTTLHPGGQQEWIRAALNTYCVTILVGRDSGKTVFTYFLVMEEGARCTTDYACAYVAQGHSQAGKFFAWCLKLWTAAGLVLESKNAGQDRWIRLRPFGRNQGFIAHFWSGDPDAVNGIRGERLNRLIVDEAGFCSPLVQDVCFPMLNSRKGKIALPGTAKRSGMGFAFMKTFFDFGIKKVPGFLSFNAPSESNPFSDPEYLLMQRRTFRDPSHPDVKTPREREEFDGDFITDLGAVFHNLDACFCLTWKQESHGFFVGRPPMPGEPCLIGQDWGKFVDHSVSSVFSRLTREQLALRIEPLLVPYEEQMDRLDVLHSRFNNAVIIGDGREAGGYLGSERLPQQYGDGYLDVKLSYGGDNDKGLHVTRMRHLFQTTGWKFLNIPEQRTQFEEFQQSPMGPNSNGLRYAAPAGKHDDIVLAGLFASVLIQATPAPQRAVRLAPETYSVDWFKQRAKEGRMLRARGYPGHTR